MPKKKLTEMIETESTEQVALESEVEVETVAGGEVTSTRRLKSYVVDLRVHSPASLGYLGIEGIDTAPALVRLARVKGLDMIAITDFHSAHFIDRIMSAARETSLKVIPGVVVRCRLAECDDVTISCLFPESFDSKKIESFLNALEIPASAFGSKDYLVTVPFEKILDLLAVYGGIALPSRMDKTPHRLSVIPLLVEKYGFRAFDLAYHDSVRFFKQRWPKIKFQLFSFSNANALAQVGSRIARLKMAESGFDGLRQIIERTPAAAKQ